MIIIYHRKGLVELGFVADEKMESVEIEGGKTEFDAAGNGDRPGVGLAHGLKPSPLPVCCCCIGFVDDAFPLPLLKEGEERMFPKISWVKALMALLLSTISDPKGFGALANKSLLLLFSVF